MRMEITCQKEFGMAGLNPGQFDEPVDIAIANGRTVYVTDTWNQRVQAFIPSEDEILYVPSAQWDVNAWFGQSLDNKPFHHQRKGLLF